MGLNEKIKELLNDFNEKLVIDTRNSLQTKLDERANKHNGKKVKSRLWASVSAPPAIFDRGMIKSKLTMNDYWAVVNDGRKASNVSEEGQAKIAEWSATRGLAEKIRVSDLGKRKEKQKLSDRKKEPTHFFDEVINDGRLKELEEKLSEILKSELIINISK